MRIQVPKSQVRRRATGAFCYAKFAGRDVAFGPAHDPETRRRFEKFVGEWIAHGCKIADETKSTPSSVTIAKLLDRYEVHAATYYRHPDGTQTGRAASVRSALTELRALYGAFPAAEFGLRHLKAAREAMVERQGGSRGDPGGDHAGRDAGADRGGVMGRKSPRLLA